METQDQIRALHRCVIPHSEEDIERIAQGHGRDGIKFYPPCEWGRDPGDPLNFTPEWASKAYVRGYEAGREEWRKFKEGGRC